MTIIVAYKESSGVVHMAADSRISDSEVFGNVAIPKIFSRGMYLFGFCGVIWPQQAVQCTLKMPKKRPPTEPQECVEWVMAHVFAKLRHSLSSFSAGKLDTPKESVSATFDIDSSDILIAWPGFVASMGLDGTVDVRSSAWQFAGCGSLISMGAAHILDTLPLSPEQKVKAAVEAAIANSHHCGGEISYLHT